jgi:hypothetical protein
MGIFSRKKKEIDPTLIVEESLEESSIETLTKIEESREKHEASKEDKKQKVETLSYDIIWDKTVNQ